MKKYNCKETLKLVLTISIGIIILLPSVQAQKTEASLVEGYKVVKDLAPKGYDLAGIKIDLLANPSSFPLEKRILISLQSVENNFIYEDINKDGKKDLVVVYEEDPKLETRESKVPCNKLEIQLDNNDYCMITYGNRVLKAYLAQDSGEFKEILSNGNIIPKGDEGGPSGDPLLSAGLYLNKIGNIDLYLGGGSRERWNEMFSFGFIMDHKDKSEDERNMLYLVGRSYYVMDTQSGKSWEKKADYILRTETIEKKQNYDDDNGQIERKTIEPSVKLVPGSDFNKDQPRFTPDDVFDSFN